MDERSVTEVFENFGASLESSLVDKCKLEFLELS